MILLKYLFAVQNSSSLFQAGFHKTLRRFLLRCLSRRGGVTSSSAAQPQSRPALAAAVTLAARPVAAAGFSDKLLSLFVLHVLSVPALVAHLKATSPESMTILNKQEFLPKCLKVRK